MKLFSYVVARDYGFAPNPFFSTCTLATCKPKIRRTASVGDWIIGTGSSKNDRQGYLVYAMCITEEMTFNEYWRDGRFQRKKPNLRGSMKQAFGDNIYFQDDAGQWQQQDSHHSYANGSSNPYNICNDTKADRILCSTDYAYWGSSGPKIPQKFRNYVRELQQIRYLLHHTGPQMPFSERSSQRLCRLVPLSKRKRLSRCAFRLAEDTMTSESSPKDQRNRATSEGTILLRDYMREIEPTDKLPQDNLQPVLMGLFGEVGSIMATAKKNHREKAAYAGYRQAVEEEFGDALWYFTTLCRRLDIGV